MQKEKEYTEVVHINRLYGMLKTYKSLACERCPATPDNDPNESPEDFWSNDPIPCLVCRGFVGLDHNSIECPPLTLGNQIALQRMVDNLRKEGFRFDRPLLEEIFSRG